MKLAINRNSLIKGIRVKVYNVGQTFMYDGRKIVMDDKMMHHDHASNTIHLTQRQYEVMSERLGHGPA